MPKKLKASALNVHMESEGISIRGYFKKLIVNLWREGESFSGKRPLGNGGWDLDVIAALVASGHLKGELDEDGCLETHEPEAHKKVLQLLQEEF